MTRHLGGSVDFVVPAEVAFDYLADPVNRPQWQSSLRRVDAVKGSPGEGQTWVDVTIPGLRPQMRTTVHDRPRRWAETGRWRAVRADLELVLTPKGTGCTVRVRFAVTGPGPLALLGPVISACAVPAVLLDVRHAARILAETS